MNFIKRGVWNRRVQLVVLYIAVLAETLSGCAVYATLTQRLPADSMAPVGQDSQRQIRDLVVRIGKALSTVDLVAANALTCTEYQIEGRGADQAIVPPMNSWGESVEQAAAYGEDTALIGRLSERFPRASDGEISSLTEAIAHRDHFAYFAITLRLIRDSTLLTRFGVDAISVVSGEATAEVTAAIGFNGRAVETQTKINHFRFERNRWTYCQHAPPGMLSQWISPTSWP